jgi:hypothetical protein
MVSIVATKCFNGSFGWVLGTDNEVLPTGM